MRGLILIRRSGMVPDPHDRRSATMATLSALVSSLDAELRRLGYKDSTMAWYWGCWRRMQKYFAARGVEEFSLDVVSVAMRKWLWHKDREVVTYSYGSPRDIMIAIL
jgi:hypothetical protein